MIQELAEALKARGEFQNVTNGILWLRPSGSAHFNWDGSEHSPVLYDYLINLLENDGSAVDLEKHDDKPSEPYWATLKSEHDGWHGYKAASGKDRTEAVVRLFCQVKP